MIKFISGPDVCFQMNNLIFLSNSVKTFDGKIKVYPHDFKVIEIKEDGLLCTDASKNSQVFSQENGSKLQSSIEKDTDKTLNKNIFIEELNPAPFNEEEQNEDVLSSKRRKLNVHIESHKVQEPIQFKCDLEWCKNLLKSLLPLSTIRRLDLLVSKILDNVDLKETLSLGCLSVKNDRTLLHKCIQYIYPRVVSITEKDYEVTAKPCSKFNSFCKILGENEAVSFMRHVPFIGRDTNHKSYQIIGQFDKDTRRMIHHEIDRHFGKFLTTKTKSSGNIIEVRRKEQMNNKAKKKTYCNFTLYKSNTETLDVIHQLAQHFNSQPYQFSYAGMKDKRAETWQQMTVEGISKQQLQAGVMTLPVHLRIDNVTMTPSPLCLGMLQGNRFIITVRDVRGSSLDRKELTTDSLRRKIEEAIESIKIRGFVNYFGSQRFGRQLSKDVKMKSHDVTEQSVELEASSIGLAILRHDMETAVKTLLRPNYVARCDVDDVIKGSEATEKAKRHLKDTGDIEGTLKMLPRFRAREIAILRALRRFGRNFKEIDVASNKSSLSDDVELCEKEKLGDKAASISTAEDFVSDYSTQAYTKALLSLPRAALFFYAHAYCSFIWNRAASERLRRYGVDVAEGDLVLPREKTLARSQVYCVTSDDVAKRCFALGDVVLPLPGYRIRFPTNMMDFYNKILKDDGVVDKSDQMGGAFRVNQLNINLSGAYRRIVEFPRNFIFEWLSDTGAGIDVSHEAMSETVERCSDSGLQGSNPPEGGPSVVRLGFDLNSSCYATVFLRELSNGGIRA